MTTEYHRATHPLLVAGIPLEELALLPLMAELEGIVLLLHLDRLGLVPPILPRHRHPRRGLRPGLDDHLLEHELGRGADDVELPEEGAAQVGVREVAGGGMLVGEQGLQAGPGQLGGRSGPRTIRTATVRGAADDELGEVGLAQGPSALGTVRAGAEVGEGALLAEDAVAAGEVAGRGEGLGAPVARQDLRGADRARAAGAGLARGGTGGDRRGEGGPASSGSRDAGPAVHSAVHSAADADGTDDGAAGDGQGGAAPDGTDGSPMPPASRRNEGVGRHVFRGVPLLFNRRPTAPLGLLFRSKIKSASRIHNPLSTGVRDQTRPRYHQRVADNAPPALQRTIQRRRRV